MTELYFSVDVEADGPIPGPHSMLSIGLAAFTEAGEQVGTFSANLDLLAGAVGHPDTMAWWQTQPEDTWLECRRDSRDPAEAMRDLVRWVNILSLQQSAKPVCVAYPAGYDWLFFYWYMIRFGQNSPFGFSCLDIKSYAMAKLGTPFRKTTKKTMPKRWFEGLPPHEHVALSDAIEQGQLFSNILKDNAKY